MAILLTLLLIGVPMLPGQLLQRTQHAGALSTAALLERKGDNEGAIAIYQDLLNKNPRNTQAYRRLKDLYQRQSEYAQAIRLIKDHLTLFPHDLPSQIELGENYYLLADTLTARQVWATFEETYQKNTNAYRLLMHTYNRLALEHEMVAVIKRGRARFHDPAFLALDLANYYNARRIYDHALDEYLTTVVYSPRQQKVITNKILLMSDEVEDEQLIEQRLIENIHRQEPILRTILAAFYFKTGRYEEALDQHQYLGLNNRDDYRRWLTLADNLRLEQQYSVALRCYEALLSPALNTPPVEIVGAALLGLGNTFEDQIIPRQSSPRLVHYFADNVFFEDHFYESPKLSTSSLESAFQLYDSVLISMPATSFSALANYRMGEIQYRITRNFDGALRSYEAALRSAPDQVLNQKIRLRIGDLLMARGELEQARNYFHYEQDREIAFSNRLIHTTLLAGAIDSSMTLIEALLKSLPPTAKEFNDLMELRDLIQQYYYHGTPTDREAFANYLWAEKLVRQHKLSEAVATLAYIREKFPETTIIPFVTLREALLRLTLNQVKQAQALAQELMLTELADYGFTLAGEISEWNENDTSQALDFYHRVLEAYPGSLLVEPVRAHIREINKQFKS